jgi:hypothetical protein
MRSSASTHSTTPFAIDVVIGRQLTWAHRRFVTLAVAPLFVLGFALALAVVGGDAVHSMCNPLVDACEMPEMNGRLVERAVFVAGAVIAIGAVVAGVWSKRTLDDEKSALGL